MAKRKAQPKSRDQGGSSGDLLDRLESAEAAAVLKRSVTVHPELRAEAEAMARSTLGEASFLSVADEVESAILALDYDDLNARAGRHSWGYVGPDEAACVLLEEAVEPYIADMKRRLEMGLEKEAREVCQGILLGLYRVRDGGGSDIVGWAPEFPAEMAGNLLEAWTEEDRKRKTGQASPARRGAAITREFVDEYLPEWEWIAGRSRARGTAS